MGFKCKNNQKGDSERRIGKKNGAAAKQYVGILACIFPFVLEK
jgi:hypothetical protein